MLAAAGAVPSLDQAGARRAASLLGATRGDNVIDALVVAHAVEAGGSLVLTSDLEDLSALAGAHPEVWVERV